MYDPETLATERKQREADGLARAAKVPPSGAEDWQSREIDGRTVEYLLHTPDAPTSPRTDIYVHGGGWVFGSPRQTLGVTRRITRQTGRTTASLRYPLSPEAPYPAAIEHVAAAVELFAQDGTLGTLSGSSAGAQVALAAMMLRRDRGQALPKAGIMWNGAFAMTATSAAHRAYGTPVDGLSTQGMTDYIAAYAPETAQDPRYADLTEADLSGLPPLWFVVGDRDPLLEDTLITFRTALAAGNAARLQVIPGRRHGFANDWTEDAEVDRSITEALTWLTETAP